VISGFLISCFPLAFFTVKTKWPHILVLSIPYLGLSFKIEKSKIERVFLYEYSSTHDWSLVRGSRKVVSIVLRKQDQKIRAIEKL
jgi:hypothetical protein